MLIPYKIQNFDNNSYFIHTQSCVEVEETMQFLDACSKGFRSGHRLIILRKRYRFRKCPFPGVLLSRLRRLVDEIFSVCITIINLRNVLLKFSLQAEIKKAVKNELCFYRLIAISWVSFYTTSGKLIPLNPQTKFGPTSKKLFHIEEYNILYISVLISTTVPCFYFF